MPHKRNPVTVGGGVGRGDARAGLVSTMLTAMVQEEERGLGGWHAEWETLPEIVRLTAGALHQMAETVPRLEIDVERMRQNLEVTRGLIYAEAVTMALGERIGQGRSPQVGGSRLAARAEGKAALARCACSTTRKFRRACLLSRAGRTVRSGAVFG